MDSPSPRETPTKTPVRGWLLFLCIWLTILVPLRHALSAAMAYWGFQWMFDEIVQLRVSQLTMLAFTLGIVLLSVVAGVNLWRKKRIGIILAVVYFIFAILDGIVKIIFNRISAYLFNSQLAQFISIGIPVFWLLYIQKSKRIREFSAAGKSELSKDTERS